MAKARDAVTVHLGGRDLNLFAVTGTGLYVRVLFGFLFISFLTFINLVELVMIKRGIDLP